MRRLVIVLLALLAISCGPKVFKTKWTKETAPESYTTRFETSKGSFDIKVTRKHSPKAADRFYQLVKHSFFDKGLFYRVYPDFVAQFGTTDATKRTLWQANKVPDEPVLKGNSRGTLSFGRGGPQSRGTDLYINLKENTYLDTINFQKVVGFPSFGKVIKGMEVVTALHSGYGDTTMDTLNLMYSNKPAFIKRFPSLDRIERVFLLED